MLPSRPAVFVDRDGTMIVDKIYLSNPDLVEFLPGVTEGLRLLRQAGFRLVMITNQSGIGRGYFTEGQMHAVHRELLRRLDAESAHLDAIYFCPLAPQGKDRTRVEHPYRKPGPGMLLHAAEHLQLDLSASWVIGDNEADLHAGRNAGCRGSVLVQTATDPIPDYDALRPYWPCVSDFLSAVRHILSA